MNWPHLHQNIFEASISHGFLTPGWVDEKYCFMFWKELVSFEAPFYFLFESGLNFSTGC